MYKPLLSEHTIAQNVFYSKDYPLCYVNIISKITIKYVKAENSEASGFSKSKKKSSL